MSMTAFEVLLLPVVLALVGVYAASAILLEFKNLVVAMVGFAIRAARSPRGGSWFQRDSEPDAGHQAGCLG